SVNGIVLTGPTQVSRAELMRVLTPRGTLVSTKRAVIETKPWPEEIDEWTHALYDATNNAVAADTLVGPPDRLRWVGAPDHCRHHNFLASVSTMVSARGRLFSIVDEGSLVSPYLPANWMVVARDAFNGITLWKKQIPDWGPTLRNFRSGPAELGRRMVAVGDEVFVTLGFEAPVSVLDAATGEQKAALPETTGTEEIIIIGGVAVMVTGSPRAELRDWSSSERDFTTGEKHRRGLVAVDAVTRRVLWKQQDTQSATVLPMTLAANDDHVFFVNAQGVNAVALRTGKQLWQTPEPVALQRRAKFAPTVVVHNGVLLYADRVLTAADADAFYGNRAKKYQERYQQLRAYPSRLRAYDAATGKRLWDCAAGESFHTPTDIIVIDDTVWYTASPAMLEGNYEDGRDLRTGEVIKRIESPPDINHGRCYRNKATSRYLLGGKNGLDFIDPLAKEARYVPRGLRATCQLGVLPCNGMVYLPPHACTCESERKVNGFLAVARGTRRPYPDPPRYGGPRFRAGPAYGEVKASSDPQIPGEWPTFRHDLARTGCAATTLPDKLDVLWERPIGRRPTAPVCAGGELYVAARDEHVLWALDATTGEPAWQYRTSGRIDSPPTVHSGLVVFGCRDGWLRCLRATDGALVWRFRGAAEERQIVVREQLESVWPLHGATLVMDGKVYCAAGRASVLDGGVSVFCLDLFSGKVLAKTTFRDEGGSKKGGGKGRDALLEVLSFVDGRITMRRQCLTPELEPAPPVDHLQSATSLLDDNFFHRSYWGYAKKVARNTTGNRNAAGYIMAIDGETAYAYARKRQYYIGHIKGFERHLFATGLLPEQEKLTPGTRKPRAHKSFKRVIGKYAPRGIALKWTTDPTVLVKGMTVAGPKLVVAGPPFELHPSSFLVDPATDGIRLASAPDKAEAANAVVAKAHAGLSGKEPPRLIVLAKDTGATQISIPLPSSPVFDGLIAACGRLYVCREDGVVTCLGATVP
ncbi:MAG: PQQ-binding-like beta-propeller repeat protein, partial [Lentisphaerae bacterium]|nr:PQQ-binding-like beta-propeller repeat protein [Lentisphaerota bacterium]